MQKQQPCYQKTTPCLTSYSYTLTPSPLTSYTATLPPPQSEGSCQESVAEFCAAAPTTASCVGELGGTAAVVDTVGKLHMLLPSCV